MTTARQKVFSHLKKTRSASAREIARALKMSAPTVRHHLSVLAADGLVESMRALPGGGRGRPEKVYSVSQAALGDNLAVLADALLDGRVDAQTLGERVAAAHDLIGDARQPLTRQLARLVERLNGMHYQARWEAAAEGPRLIFGRCPYSRIIENHPELCRMDAALLSKSLGLPITQLTRSEAVARGSCPLIHLIG